LTVAVPQVVLCFTIDKLDVECDAKSVSAISIIHFCKDKFLMKKFMSVSSLARRFSLILATLLLTASTVGFSVAQTQTQAQPAVATPPMKSVGEAKVEYDPTQPNSGPAVDTKDAKGADKSANAADKKSFLWEVKSATNTVYLFGTIHVGKKSFYPLPDAVEKALAGSKKVVVEADISKTDGLADISKMIMYEAPDTLERKIPSALFARLKTQLVKFKIPADGVKPMKPFMIGALLSVNEFTRLGYDMNFGVDAYLIASANKQMKPILELESQLGQIELLTNMHPLLQETFLENALTAIEAGAVADQMSGVVTAWQTGDAKLMQDVVAAGNKNGKRISEFDEILLYSRHPAMVKKVEGFLLDDQPHFVAVGSLHLLGPKGLVELLAAKGYKIRQL
jgi:uncharacterized protein